MEPAKVRFGPFEADLHAREVFRDGKKLSVQEQPFQLLAALLEKPGQLVTRDELRQRMWSSNTFVDFDLALNKAVAKLRDVLEDDAASPRYIETLPKRGYRFIAPVSTSTAAESSSPKARRFRPWISAAVLLSVAAMGLLLQRDDAPTNASIENAVIAVLPFKNLTGNPKENYLSDGMTVELITALTRISPSQLRVIGPTSAFSYRDTVRSVRDIAAELGADYVVEGSVRSDAERVRIDAQLTRGKDQTVIWAKTFDETRGNLFDLQSKASGSIAEAVRGEVTPRYGRSASRPTSNEKAYDAYLWALHYQRMKGQSSLAQPWFQRAVELDPNFAEAWVGLANANTFLKPALEFMPQAKEAARRAIALDPNLGSAHAALGTLHLMWDWNWPAAQAEFDRALRLAPQDSEVLKQQAQYLASVGKLDQAIVAARRAQELDPRSPLIGQILGRLYYFNHQPENAMHEWKRSLELDPDFYWSHLFLSFAYEDRGQFDRWFEHRKRAFEISGAPAPQLAEFDRIARTAGYEHAARVLLNFHEELARKSRAESLSLAISYAKRGNRDKALYWLEQGLENRTNDAIYLGVEPAFDSLRNDPRFQSALLRLGIADHSK